MIYIALTIVTLPSLGTNTVVIIDFIDTDVSERTDHLCALIDISLTITP